MSLLLLMVLLYILIQVPAVQNFARGKAVAYLENKLHTKVQVNKLSLSFPKSVVLEGVYFEDQRKDTLFAGGRIEIDIAFLKLIHSEVEINKIELKDLTANIYRLGNDTNFNYQYIIDAFASPKTTKPADTAASKISVDKIVLNNVGGTFRDAQTGMNFSGRIGQFQTAFKKFDLDKMIFNLLDITLDGLTGHLYQNKPLLTPQPTAVVEAKSNEPFNLQLGLENISIKKVLFDYKNDVSVMSANLNLGELSGKVKSIDLAKLDVQLEKVVLHNTTAAVVLGKSEQTKIVKKEIVKEAVAQANNPWKVGIGSIDLSNNNIAFDDNNIAAINKGMDFSHLKIEGLTFQGNDFVFTPTAYAGNVTAGAFKEKSGFNLRTLQTNFAYSDTGATLKNLLVQTDKTTIRDNIAVAYPSVEAATKDVGKLYLDANFTRSDLAVKDILLLAPQLQANLKGNENAVLHVDARVKGYVNNLNIPGLQVTGIGNTAVSMSGTIKGLPDVNKTVYDFNIANFQTTKADINKLIPPGTIPATVRIPDVMKVSGKFKGLATNFTTDMLLQTNKGNARVAGFVNSNNETYNLKGSLNNVDVGYLAKQDTLVGKVTMSFAANGRGFTPSKMVTKASAKVQSAYVMGYNYQNLDLTASVNKGQSVIDATMADKSLAFRLNGEALIDDKFATNIKLRLLLDSILLQPLGFATTDLRVHGSVVADIPTSDINAPQGNIQIGDLLVYNDGQRYKADSIEINASSTDTGNVITLKSQIATAALRGKYNLATMGPGAMQLINKYYSLGIKDSAITNDKWTLDARIIPDSLLFTFAPSLAGTDTIKVAANFDGSAAKMNLLVNASKIQMGTQVLDSVTLTAGNDADKFAYALSMNSAGSKAFRLEKTSVDGFITNNELHSKLNIKDGNEKDKYQLGFKAVQEKNGAIKANLSDSLMLDYDNWNVDKSNYIHFDRTGVIVHNFTISNNGQSLSINSAAENVAAPININLKDFHIKTLTNLADQDSLNVDGVINGDVVVKNAMTSPVFTSDIVIDTLIFNRDTLGTVTVKVDNATANAYNANVAITGNGNDIQLGGKYYTGESRMDMKLDLNNFNMATLLPLSFGALRQSDGSLKGGVVIKGTTTKPDLDGSLRFENANITPTASGEKLHLSDEAITIKSPDIVFDNFTLIDSAGNKAIVDGKITSPDFTTFNFDLSLSAKNFRALTAPPKQNALYYGDLNMDADVTIKGTLTAPVINADLKINKTTNITFVLPSTNPEIEGREGVVQFVDMYGGNTDSLFKAAIDTLNNFPAFAGMDVSGTLQSDTAAQITLVIDERSGDALKIRGKADLAGGIDKSGKISLTGAYELQNGSYQLSLSLLKRQFIIQPGSIITWNGDPMSATADITAIYIANTQPVNLLQSELSNLSSSDINKYKAKVPFNVLLKMKGELLKPQISFGIELPADQQSKWEDVQTKLEQIKRDETELNKQVFALLLLGRFIQENPLENAADGTSLATTAKSSVSRILVEQLNNLAGSLVKGVDLNFGVTAEDDYTSGTRQSRTDLTVGVSKNLLNDRLRVSVGSNFALEGPANTNQAASNIAGDVAADYLLSKDGRYTLRAYRRNRYEGVIEGQVIESGVSFIFTFDFNEFKQIFDKKTEEQKLLEKAEKERRKTEKKTKAETK